MASAKIDHTNGGYTVTLRSGDWHGEYLRDAEGHTFRIIRAYDGAMVKKLPVPVDVFRDVLETAQQYAAADNAVLQTLKKHRNAGVQITFK